MRKIAAMRRFKIYLPFFKNEFKSIFAYRFNVLLWIISDLLAPFISFYLWKAIYGSASADTLGGLTQAEMIVYVFMSFVTSQIVTTGIAEYMRDDITEGTVAMTLIKPLDYRLSLISRAAANSFFRMLVPGVFVFAGVEIYKAAVLGIPAVSVANVFLFLFSIIMSFLIYVLFDFCFGMIAFVTTHFFGLFLVKSAILSFLSGALIPISFFPGVLQTVFDMLPFASMIYSPVMVYLGKYGGWELVFVLARQVFWVIFLYFLGSLLWRKVTKRLTVLGG